MSPLLLASLSRPVLAFLIFGPLLVVMGVMASLEGPTNRVPRSQSAVKPQAGLTPTPSAIPATDPALNDPARTDRLSFLDVGHCGVYRPYRRKGADLTRLHTEGLAFKNAGAFTQGLAPVWIEGKCGYLAPQGQLVVPAQFEEALQFKAGLAGAKFQGKWGFINPQGRWVIEPQFERVSSFQNGLAIVQQGRKQGFIDPTGKLVLGLKYSEVSPFVEDLAAVKWYGKYGYINRSGEFVIPPRFMSADDFSQGLARINAGGAGVYFINRKGQAITHSGQFTSATQFEQGFAIVTDRQGRHGLLNAQGKVVKLLPNADVIQIRQTNASPQPLTPAQQGQLWGYQDPTGDFKIPPQFTQADAFSEGLAKVELEDGWAYIDSSGKVIAQQSGVIQQSKDAQQK
jgi:WG containing repeat